MQNTVAEENTAIFIPKVRENRKIKCFFLFNQAFRFWCIFHLKSVELSKAVMHKVKKLSHRLVLFLASDSTRMISKLYSKSTAIVLTFFLCLLYNYILHIEFSPASWAMSIPYTYWKMERKSYSRNTEKRNLHVYYSKTVSAWLFMKNSSKAEFSDWKCKDSLSLLSW